MKMLQYVDENARPLKANINMFTGMSLNMIAADKDLAIADIDPPEMMVKLFIRPDKPIENLKSIRTAVYQFKFNDTTDWTGKINLPRAGCQHVVWADQSTACLVIDLDQPVNPIDDLPDDKHLDTSVMLNHQDDAVRQLIDLAFDTPQSELDMLSKSAIAQRLRRFVAGYITAKDLSVGLATASEVARTAQGDCTEHAVLLAALLRAVNIPSRTVSGLVYVDDKFLGQTDIFGYHMWTQAWLEMDNGARWVDLDPAMEHDFDVTHIALTTSAMADDGMTNDLVRLLPIIGNLQISVMEVVYDDPENTPADKSLKHSPSR